MLRGISMHYFATNVPFIFLYLVEVQVSWISDLILTDCPNYKAGPVLPNSVNSANNTVYTAVDN